MVSFFPVHIRELSIKRFLGQNESQFDGARRRKRSWLPSFPTCWKDTLDLATAAGRTNEETMNGVTLAQKPNDASTSETHHSSAGKVKEANHDVCNMIILGLVLGVAFLAIFAAYGLSSIFRSQN
jgi:hypothetical protein